MKKIIIAALSLASLIGSTVHADTVARAWWTADQNNDGAYNYSTTAMWGGSSLNVANQWNDAAIGEYKTGPYGDTRMPTVKLHFEHNGSGYAEANLPTSVNPGQEPVSMEDRDAGKAFNMPMTRLAFSAPGHENNVKVRLIDAHGHYSRAVSIADYRGDYGRYWFDYSIPLADFKAEGFDYEYVKFVTFFVDDSVQAGSYKLDLLSLNFLNTNPFTSPLGSRPWWTEEVNGDGAVNYSTTYMPGGSTINTANQWGDVVVGSFLAGPTGESKIPSINMIFTHDGVSNAEAAINTSVTNLGHEPISEADRDTGKKITSDMTLSIQGRGMSVRGVKVRMYDTEGYSSSFVDLVDYQGTYDRYWYNYHIPVSVLVNEWINLDSIKSIVFFVDQTTPSGIYDVHVVRMGF